MSEPTAEHRESGDFWADARFCVAQCWRAHRTLTAAFLVIPLVQGLLPAALVLVLRGLINEVVALRSSGSGDVGQVRVWVVLGLAISLASATLGALSTYVTSAHYEWLDTAGSCPTTSCPPSARRSRGSREREVTRRPATRPSQRALDALPRPSPRDHHLTTLCGG